MAFGRKMAKNEFFLFGRSNVGRTGSYEITRSSVFPTVRPFVRPKLSFLKIGSLDFSDIVLLVDS